MACFFRMLASFTEAVWGTEGVGENINVIIGNGFTKNHTELTLKNVRESLTIRSMYERLYFNRFLSKIIFCTELMMKGINND